MSKGPLMVNQALFTSAVSFTFVAFEQGIVGWCVPVL